MSQVYESQVYDPLALGPNQLESGYQIVSSFETSGSRWVMLCAQMQSGKTETYLFAACEMIRLGHVKNVVIFSGNAETDLRDQLKKEVEGRGDAKFYGKYELYLEEQCGITSRNRMPIMSNIKVSICVVWGTELKNYSGPLTETLFIWEESHHAQSINNCPAKFLRSVGISADGNVEVLARKSNYVASISATPFSEFSDLHHLNQEKVVVNMMPGVGYTSVKDIRDSGRLKSYSSLTDGLPRALATPHSRPMYAIIRISVKNEETVKSLVTRSDWSYVVYDSLATGLEKEIGDNVWRNMNRAPEMDTAILIRGKCRMGKNLEKTNILFMFETAKNSNTDTVLQGLLGRTCGYSAGSDKIEVWLHAKIVKSGEINRYVEMVEGGNIIPTKALNIVKGPTVKTMHPIVPIHVPFVFEEDTTRRQLIHNIRSKITLNEVPIGKTELEQFDEIVGRFMDTRTEIVCHDVSGNERERFEPVSKAIGRYNSTSDYVPVNLWFTGVEEPRKGLEEGRIINVFFYRHNDFENDIPAGSAYIFGVTRAKSSHYAERTNIPSTTGREIFAYGLEDGTTKTANGSFRIDLDPETAESVQAMMDSLTDIIEISLRRPNCARRIDSNWDEKTKDYKGIILNKHVFSALSPGGLIHNKIKNDFGIDIILVKHKGPQPRILTVRGFVRFASILW